MNKEKEIEEMASLICNGTPDYCEYNEYHIACDACEHYCEAHNLYEAGYRKAEEVRKETAKEIAEWLKSQDYDFAAEIILKKYGVEVDG